MKLLSFALLLFAFLSYCLSSTTARACSEFLTPEEPGQGARQELIIRLSKYVDRSNLKIEDLMTQLEGILAEEVKILGGPFYLPPSISPNTMRVLLQAYGSESQINFRDRLKIFPQIIPALLNDPYFSWLDQKNKSDPIAFFIKPLESSGSQHLNLSLSLLRLRAAMDPSFPKSTAAATPALLYLYARTNLATLDLMRLRLSSESASNDLVRNLWSVSRLDLLNEHYNAAFENEKHHYPYLDFQPSSFNKEE